MMKKLGILRTYHSSYLIFHIVIIVFQRIIIFLIENIIHRDSFVGRHRLIYIRYCWILSVTFNDMIRDNIGSNRFIYS
jgi:hypothetical protein